MVTTSVGTAYEARDLPAFETADAWSSSTRLRPTASRNASLTVSLIVLVPSVTPRLLKERLVQVDQCFAPISISCASRKTCDDRAVSS
jgi:hypothetical protein